MKSQPPTGWGITTLSDGLETIIDYRGKTPPKSPSGIPLISAANVKKGRVVLDIPQFISPQAYERWTTRGFTHPGDVLITTEAPAGEVAPYPRQGTYLISRRVMALRADERLIHHGYLLYVLQSKAIQQELIGRSRGTTVPRVLKPDITGLMIPTPPLPEQRRIAAVLGALDDKIELNRQMNRTLEEMAQAIFKSWFIDFDGHEDLVDSELGPVPRGWQVVELGSQIMLDKGLSYKSKYLDSDGLPFVNLKCILPGGGFKRDGLKYYSGEYKPAHVVKPGDVVVAMTDLTQRREVLASPAIVPRLSSHEPILMSLDLSCPRPRMDSCISQLWMFHLLNTPLFKQFARGFANGTTVLHLRKDGITRFVFVAPPNDFVTRFEAVGKPIRERVWVSQLESETLAELRNTLLPKLISGQIRVPEAEEIVEDVT